jgi:hypothetical protein
MMFAYTTTTKNWQKNCMYTNDFKSATKNCIVSNKYAPASSIYYWS